MTTTLEVFDPAMCCSTGVCGPSVDADLARFEADLRWLAAEGTSVTRYGVADDPVLIAFAGQDGAGVAAAHGDDDGVAGVVVQQRGGELGAAGVRDAP